MASARLRRRSPRLALLPLAAMIGACATGGGGGGGPTTVAALPFPQKQVPIQWCLVDDDRNLPGTHTNPPERDPDINDGEPEHRFSRLRRNIALWRKSREFAPANVHFVEVGPVLHVRDPHPNNAVWKAGGEFGDVADPGDGLRDEESGSSGGSNTPIPAMQQWRAVRNACIAHAQYVPGVMVEIVIRRFVTGQDNDNDGKFDEDSRPGKDYDTDGQAGEDGVERAPIWGLSPQANCSMEPPPIDRTPTVIDPENFPGVFATGRFAILNFAITLAHENGHALCLRHGGGGLMAPFAPPFTSGLTAREIANLRAQAQHMWGTRDKDEGGQTIPRPGPITIEVLDTLDDAPESVDILAAAAALREDGRFGMMLQLDHLLERDAGEAIVRFEFDTDNDPATGSADGYLEGADRRLTLKVATAGELSAVAASVEQHEGGWVSVGPVEAEIRIEPIMMYDTPMSDVFHVVVPTEAIAPGTDYRFAAGIAATGGRDATPVGEGTTTPVDYLSGPTLSVESTRVPAGTLTVTIAGSNYTPGTTAVAFVGSKDPEDVQVDSEGRFTLTVRRDTLVRAAPVALPDGTRFASVTVHDGVVGGDVVTLSLGE